MSPIVDPTTVEAHTEAGYWSRRSLGDVVRELAATRPGAPAFVTEHGRVSWAGYDERGDVVAAALAGCGVAPGDRVGVLLPDGADVHAAFLGTERAGAVAVGVGARAGAREVDYLLTSTGARALVTQGVRRGVAADQVLQRARAAGAPLDHLVVMPDPADPAGEVHADGRAVTAATARELFASGGLGADALGPNDLFLVNSTSGTTGLPKRVMQFQNRWHYFHQLVEGAVQLQPDDVMMSVIPAPFGFGLWTAHFTPTLGGVPVVVMERFDADGALELIAAHGVTILCCVSTQFILMLGSGRLGSVDLSSLRAIFTGGEAVPFHRASEFEERTGSRVLQFYGSNETGAYSNTSLADGREERLTTCGRVIETMAPRLYADGADITASGGPGQPACRGPANCAGYYDDPEGNARLYTPDGWMLMEDVATIDERGYVRLTGRTSEFIIRGGKNISAAAVEDAVGTHPGIALVAAVPVPDDVFGERVGVFVVGRQGAAPTLDELVTHLDGAGFSKESFPEHLFVVDDLPRASGGKVAKSLLREDAARRVG